MEELSALLAERPHLFSETTLSLPAAELARMAAVIAAVERVVALPAYREHVLAYGPDIARREAKGQGAFFGYDFHLSPSGPQLIEINTNAGGGLLCAWRFGDEAAQAAFVDMFRAECGGPLGALAIVDEAPAAQYLYPEFLLFRQLFERHGIRAVICGPEDLALCHGGLWFEETRLDLVYNRLTDFALAAPACAALRQAYLDGAAVTPHPRAHALYADKRNLAGLSDGDLLASWGVDRETQAVLAAGVPATEAVTREKADDLWSRRKGLFFKPAGGYGSKAAYRGDKMTTRVFEAVLAGDYVAQALVPPSLCNGLKADIRNYAYHGRVQLVAARLYQGQTTNFRTPGGGFAKVESE
ncbi:MAG TPA: hypothetical protein VMB75_10770 [Rhodocyclaceae bacterium]|nr:hypothetical protein [Rhodocyclaceae bacterium]